MLKIVILFFGLFLISCSSSPWSSTGSSAMSFRAPADEGFYSLSTSGFGFDQQVINKVKFGVGQLFVKNKITYTKQEVKNWREKRCLSKEGIYWLGSLCVKLNDKKCDVGCEVEDFISTCSGGKIGSHFVTAKHCIPVDSNQMMAKFVKMDGSLLEVPLQLDKATHHTLPYDISILRSLDSANFDQVPSLEISSEMSDGDPVFAIGFPYVDESIRPRKNSDYQYVVDGMRITFGKIVDSNPKKWSYCAYSNDIKNANPKKWRLEKSCQSVNYSKFSYNAREERNVILANTDMIYGMSGSFLFSAKGKVLGIGSTVKTKIPGNYSIHKAAIHSKAENLENILKLSIQ